MAGELAASRRRLERSAVELERKHQDVEGRRRYVETMLERIATGVVSVDAAGRIGTLEFRGAPAARHRLATCRASARPTCSARPSSSRSATLLDEQRDGARHASAGRPIARDGRELHLAVVTPPLRREDGVTTAWCWSSTT